MGSWLKRATSWPGTQTRLRLTPHHRRRVRSERTIACTGSQCLDDAAVRNRSVLALVDELPQFTA